MSARRCLATPAVATALALTSAAGAARASAQPTIADPPGPLVRDLERSAILKNIPDGRKGGKTGEIYEGYLATHFVLWQTLGRADSNALAVVTWRRHGASALTFTMTANVRQTLESSAPVRTPSYMPKLTYERFSVWRENRGESAAERSRGGVRTRGIWLSLGHYSNGQDGCLFRGQVPTDDTDGDGVLDDGCVFPAGTTPAPGRFEANRRDGSFSSHYLQGGFSLRRATLDPSIATASGGTAARGLWAWTVVVRDYHALAGLPGGMSEELRGAYGATRLRVQFDRLRLCLDARCTRNPVARAALRASCLGSSRCNNAVSQLRFEAWAEGLFDAPRRQVPLVRAAVEVARTFYGPGNLGPFVRLYYGQDDYNLGFLTALRELQLGVTIDPERLPVFKSP